ncbi:tRNA dihydrouridine synthase DusB [Coraliomargarita sp. SDUM461004]|uniref:tRNA-dihydrouridine synthase n=1 Tax=Thalassobacterium sedimentorum TaxID=3041258 RepID=A0ABU1AJU0_9BACT|nr:tRNA dihydrouridine synthase DusB [Coraliomargarita sp. SDUM461004]MDQ8195061.1 tRNA dihydrouridine synthase DusB [Coraliomargarita sp. SDUM461004]
MLPWFQDGKFPLYLAPMARFTDIIFREFCKEQGADVMVTEFVQADALTRDDPKLWETVDFTVAQRPMGVQIFGSNPDSMAAAARMLVDRLQPDFIDINFGCPADRVICMDAGSSMLRNPKKLGMVTGAVVRAVPDTPVTVKIRTGWDDDSIVAKEVGHIVECEGAQALAIHGRTKVQGYRGDANWPVIAEVAEELTIPVVGNGNISSAEDVIRIQQQTNCSGLMIGRAALGYPWIFRDIKHYLKYGVVPEPPSIAERWETIIDYTRKIMARPYREQRHSDLRWMRPKFIALTKGMEGSRRIRGSLGQVNQIEDLERVAQLHIARLAQSESSR